MNAQFKKIFRPFAWLLVLNIVFGLLLFLKYIDYRYEYALFHTMARNNAVIGDETKTFKNLVELTYRIQKARSENVKGLQGMTPLKAFLFRSGDMQLLDATGSCGNFSHVLAEFCRTLGMPVRIVQLKLNGIYGAHIVVEAKVNGKWAAADCLFKMYFVKPDSSLASMEEVRKGVGDFSDQFPPNYPYADAYADFRYTNWDKIPVIMPAFKWLLTQIKGEEFVANFSLRIYFLNLHKAQFFILLLLYIPVFMATIYHLFLFIKNSNLTINWQHKEQA